MVSRASPIALSVWHAEPLSVCKLTLAAAGADRRTVTPTWGPRWLAAYVSTNPQTGNPALDLFAILIGTRAMFGISYLWNTFPPRSVTIQ